MKIKTSELIDAALNWAVAKALQQQHGLPSGYWTDPVLRGNFAPSTDWSRAGPIIEREKLLLQPDVNHEGTNEAWSASALDGSMHFGISPLVAAMRCYCCAKLGKYVDIPEELCQRANS